MTLLPLSQCENILDLPENTLWQRPLPLFAVGGLLVTRPAGSTDASASSTDEMVVNLSAPLEATLHSLYPSASWYELLRLKDSGRLDEDSWTSFLGLYGMRWSDDLRKTLVLRFSRPLEAQLIDKGVGPREVAPLLLIFEPLRPMVLDWIFSTAASRNQVSRLIELISEIVAITGNSPAALQELRAQFAETPPPDRWLKRLETIRFPQTSRRDQERLAQLKSLDLPLRVTADYKRQGDETCVEVRISAKGPSDLKRLLGELTSKPWEDAWKSH